MAQRRVSPASKEISKNRKGVSVTGVGMTLFTDRDKRSLVEILTIAAERALSDASVEPGALDTIHVGNMAAEAFNGQSGLANALAGRLGASGCSTHRIENTSATGASTFLDAVDAIRAGRSNVTLAVSGERMSTSDTTTTTEIISRITHEREYSQGITLPSLAGLAAEKYLRVNDANRRALARVAVKNHSNAAQNPFAQFDSDVSVDDVLDSPMIAEPLRLYDCCPIGDGAAAAVLTAGEDGIRVAATTSAVGTHAVADRTDPLVIESVREAGMSAYETAGFGPEAIDVACIHDAFTILEWMEMEELGLANRGDAWRLTVEGETEINGRLPINPGGGLKARGHPLGATGLAQIVELVWQLRGCGPTKDKTSGSRVVNDASRALALNVAGFGNNSVCTLLEGNT